MGSLISAFVASIHSVDLDEDLDQLDWSAWVFEEGFFAIWATTQENLSSQLVNNKGADQPVYLRSLIRAFVIGLLESIIS